MQRSTIAFILFAGALAGCSSSVPEAPEPRSMRFADAHHILRIEIGHFI